MLCTEKECRAPPTSPGHPVTDPLERLDSLCKGRGSRSLVLCLFLPAACQRPTTSARPRDRHSRTYLPRHSHSILAKRYPLCTEEHVLGHAGRCGASARNLVTWISRRLAASSDRTPSDLNLELAHRTSSSLHRARAIHSHVHLVAWRDGLPPSPSPLSPSSSPLPPRLGQVARFLKSRRGRHVVAWRSRWRRLSAA